MERKRAEEGRGIEPQRRRMSSDAGYYGPGSVTWQLTRESVMLLGGPRALLLQLAHPLVAAGVADHSSFREDPLRRLWRTLDATLTIVFGTREEADQAAAQIDAVHERVRGTLRETVGRFPAGTPYDARDPELLLWVHATLIDTTLTVYPRYVRPLDPTEEEAAYQESKVAARLLGVPADILPPTLDDFRRWFAETLASDSIAVGSFQRELAQAVLYPKVPFVPRRLFGLTTAITVGLLPEKLRAAYGLELTPLRRRLYELSPRMVRGLLPLLPGPLRHMPHARRALRRCG